MNPGTYALRTALKAQAHSQGHTHTHTQLLTPLPPGGIPTTHFSPRTTLLTPYTIMTQADHVRSSFSYRMHKWYPEIPVHRLPMDQ